MLLHRLPCHNCCPQWPCDAHSHAVSSLECLAVDAHHKLIVIAIQIRVVVLQLSGHFMPEHLPRSRAVCLVVHSVAVQRACTACGVCLLVKPEAVCMCTCNCACSDSACQYTRRCPYTRRQLDLEQQTSQAVLVHVLWPVLFGLIVPLEHIAKACLAGGVLQLVMEPKGSA